MPSLMPYLIAGAFGAVFAIVVGDSLPLWASCCVTFLFGMAITMALPRKNR